MGSQRKAPVTAKTTPADETEPFSLVDDPAEKLAAILVGLGIGVLAGLSVSPVIQTVVSSLIGLAAAILGVLAALPRASTDTGGSVTKEQVEPKPLIPLTNREPSFIPLAFLTTALVGGMVVGVLMRTNEVLAIWPQVATWRWAKVTGIPPSEISKRLFNELHPEHPPARSGDSDDKKDSAKDQAMNRGIPLSAGVGFSAAAPKEYCAKISGERGERLQIIMIGLGTSPYAELAKALSVRDVERTVDLVLCPTKTSH